MDLKLLASPFLPSDIEWRIGRSGVKDNKTWATALAYVTNRAIMNRLDDVCGPENWKNEFAPGPAGGIVCGISIRVPDYDCPGERLQYLWVTKWDGAENTDIESVKGGLSDAMKRAAVQWGIGRYLYNLDEAFVDCSTEKKQGWNYAKGKDGAFYWQTPKLPSWALPAEPKQATSGPGAANSEIPVDPPADAPVAKPPRPQMVTVLEEMKKCKARLPLDQLFERAMTHSWTETQKTTIRNCYMNCSEKLPAKDLGADMLPSDPVAS